MEMTLEKEFRQYKMLHMFAVLKAKMFMYHEVVLANSVQLPPFMGGETAEDLAQKDVEELFNRDINEFIEMYEKAYQELAAQGEI